MGVVLRQNPPCALIRVLTGQQTSETINVWLKKLQFITRGFSLGRVVAVGLALDLYDELEEVELNLSYNSIAAYLKMNVSQQNISLSELLNPLVTRAKLYSNPLFRQDVMNNEKLVRWGKGMLRKTKQMATILSTPSSMSPTEQGAPWSPPQRLSFQSPPQRLSFQSPPQRLSFQSSPREISDDDDIQIEEPSRRHSLPHEDDSHRSIEVSHARSQDSIPEDKKKGSGMNFLSRLFKPKKPKEDTRLPRRSSSRSANSTELSRDRSSSRSSLLQEDEPLSRSYDPVPAQFRSDAVQPRAHTPKPIRRSHKLYRSYSDDISASESRMELGTSVHNDMDDVLSEIKPVESAANDGEKRLWLNVNSTAPAHPVGAKRSADA